MTENFAEFKAMCASLGIQTYAKTDGSGQEIDIAIDREGLNKLIELGILPEDPTKHPAWEDILKNHGK